MYTAGHVEPFLALQIGRLACACSWDKPQDDEEIGLASPFVRHRVQGHKPPTSDAECTSKRDHSCNSLPKKSEADSSHAARKADCHTTLARALQSGEYAIAFQELGKLKAQGGALPEFLTGTDIERIQRLGGHYLTSLGKLSPPAADFVVESSTATKSSVALKIADGLLQMRCTFEFENCDFLWAWVALCEQDTKLGFDRNDPTGAEYVQCVEIPGSSSAFDSLLHIKANAKAINKPSDSIWHVSYINALHDANPMVWMGIYSPADAAAKVISGIEVPPPEAGVLRVDSAWGYYIIYPMGADRFRLETASCFSPDRMTYNIMRWLPSFVIRRLMRDAVLNFAPNLQKAVREHQLLLEERMKSGPRASYYLAIQQYLQEQRV